jgi:hypothetical protein
MMPRVPQSENPTPTPTYEKCEDSNECCEDLLLDLLLGG